MKEIKQILVCKKSRNQEQSAQFSCLRLVIKQLRHASQGATVADSHVVGTHVRTAAFHTHVFKPKKLACDGSYKRYCFVLSPNLSLKRFWHIYKFNR